ncbi:hypothetical protein M514_16895 [Trichuris suis]|uniref:Uncharacterized protein n=1 Tax=Trichuris suis TaxID=68888 RepID=A0A085NMS7_9BILA|nr:hypothetical protein M514_16895 [Trichuris suis]
MTARLQNKHATEQDECHITDIMKYGTFFNGTRPIPSSACCHIMKTLQTGSDAFSESSEFIRKKKQVQRTQYALNMATDINNVFSRKIRQPDDRMLLYCLLDVSCELQWACNHLKVEWLILTKYFEEVLLPGDMAIQQIRRIFCHPLALMSIAQPLQCSQL